MFKKIIIEITRIRNSLSHFTAGFISGFISYTNPAASFGIILLFLSYEISENIKIGDTLFPEILEFTIGYIVGVISCPVLNLLRIL